MVKLALSASSHVFGVRASTEIVGAFILLFNSKSQKLYHSIINEYIPKRKI